MSAAISPISSSMPTSTLSTPPASVSSPGLADESTFLTLLVSQLQNQDPLNPADSTQFVTQLAQFSQLEDLQNINQNVMTLTTDVGSSGMPATTPATNTTGITNT